MARTTNYDNRRVSLSIYARSFNAYADKDQQVATSLNGDSGGYVCAGIVKLCQSVLVFLLSDDVIFDSTWGSALPRQMTGMSIQSFAASISDFFAMACSEAVRQLSANERSDAPDDERISSARMINWDYLTDGTGITVTIRVISVAGDARDIVVPVGLSI